MALILNIETSTRVCSVALAKQGQVLALREASEPNLHAKMLTTFVEEVLQETGYKLLDVEAIAMSQGPGSYTGLRIGLSTAKGLCYALDKPLIAIDTLQAMAHLAQEDIKENFKPNTWFLPMIDARRMEVYTAAYNLNGLPEQKARALILENNSLDDMQQFHYLIISGDGAEKSQDLYGNNPKINIYPNITNSARGMVKLSYAKWQSKSFEDLAYFTPFYLKNFVAAPSKVKGLYA